MPNLIPTKFLDFKGLERNSNQPDRSSNLLNIKNMVSHQKPGTLKLREGYELRYSRPSDATGYSRLENLEYVSFDNFFERTAGQGTEITVEVTKAEVVAPTISGSKITTYKYRAPQIWMRPYWNGSYWLDQWQWLNEAYITKVTAAPDATYKVQIEVEGYFGNLAQWTLVNVTKNKLLPYAVLRSEENSGNTKLWLGFWNADIEVDDEVVIMRNYIPIEVQIANYDVSKEEISFHRIFSKMRIGFGGKENRYGLAVQFLKSTIQMNDYSVDFSLSTEIQGTEQIFAAALKTVCNIYTAFNYNEADYDMKVDTSSGLLAAGTYYFKMTVVLDGTDEIQVKDTSVTVDSVSKFLVTPKIRLGSFNRRITSSKIYVSTNDDDYYLFGEYEISRQQTLDIQAKNVALDQDGYLKLTITSSASDLFTEDNAASSGDTNSVGSWESDSSSATLSVIAASNFALNLNADSDIWAMALKYPVNVMADIPIGKSLDVTINHKATTAGTLVISYRYTDDDDPNVHFDQNVKAIPVTTGFAAQTFEMFAPPYSSLLGFSLTHIILTYTQVGMISSGDDYQLEEFSIAEADTEYYNSDSELGESMLTELGYQGTYNLVTDWMDAIIRNGITWLAGSYFKGDGRYDNKVFASQISGLSANMHDVVPAQTFVDVDRYKGEVIVGMALLPNNTLIVFKDGAPIIVDPDTGQIYEAQRGDGCVIKNSIVVIRSTVYWQSHEDILKMSAATGYLADPVSDRYVRDILDLITDKTKASAVLDKYGSYRIALVDDKEGVEFPELLLTSRGWKNQTRYHHPQVYRNGLGGRVWFMNEGDIYAFPFDEDAFIGYADVYGNYDSGW